MNMYYALQIIPLLFSLIHINTTGWVTYNGNLEIVYFIRDEVTIDWGIQFIDIQLGSTHFQMKPPQLINFANTNIPSVSIDESSISEYYVLLTLYYAIVGLTAAPLLYYVFCTNSSNRVHTHIYAQPQPSSQSQIQQSHSHSHSQSQSRTYYQLNSPRDEDTNRRSENTIINMPASASASALDYKPFLYYHQYTLCSKYLFIIQLVKTLIHIGVVSALFSYMSSNTLCLDDVHDSTGIPRLLELNKVDCNYGWQATSYPIALIMDILITAYYGCNICQSKRSRKNSEQGTELLEVS